MIYSYFTEKLLGLKDVIIKNVEDNAGNTEIHIEKPVKSHICPECGKSTSKVHDYRNQRITDIPAFGKKTVLILHKRRYKCECGKCFYEKVDLRNLNLIAWAVIIICFDIFGPILYFIVGKADD